MKPRAWGPGLRGSTFITTKKSKHSRRRVLLHLLFYLLSCCCQVLRFVTSSVTFRNTIGIIVLCLTGCHIIGTLQERHTWGGPITTDPRSQNKMARSLYVTVSQAIDNQLVASLTPSEYQVLRFVNERTLRYGKEWEAIPMRHFLDGVYQGDGTLLHAGLPFAKSTIIKAYQRLVERGILLQKEGTRNRFAIHYETLLTGAADMAVAARGLKRGKSKAQTVTERTTNTRQTVTERTTSSIKEQKLRSNGYPSAAAQVDVSGEKTPTQAIEETVAKSRKRMAEKASKLSENITIDNLRAAWTNAHLSHRSGRVSVSIGPKDLSRFRAIYRQSKVPVPLTEFLDWAIARWGEIGKNEMKWVKGFPAAPDIGFFTVMMKYFVRAFSEFHEREWEENDRRTALRRAAEERKVKQGPPLGEEGMAAARRLQGLLDQRERELAREREMSMAKTAILNSMKKADQRRRPKYPAEMKEIKDLEIAPMIPFEPII